MCNRSNNRKYKEKDRSPLHTTAISMKDPEHNVAVLRTSNKKWIMKFKTQNDYQLWIETYESTCKNAPEKQVAKRKLSYALETKNVEKTNENSKLLPKQTPKPPETEGNCSCSVM